MSEGKSLPDDQLDRSLCASYKPPKPEQLVVPEGALTSDYYKCQTDMPDRFYHPDSFKGYGAKKGHMLYRTTNMDYGSRGPSVHTMQTTFRDRPQKFTNHLGKCGMYRNRSLNTGEDKSVVPEH